MNTKYIAHHGVPGQKHGDRRYQYEDGSLTPLGREHYGVGVKRYQNEDGSLTPAGRQRYYTNGWSLSRAGKRAVDKAHNSAERIFSKKVQMADFNGDKLNLRKEHVDNLATTTVQLKESRRELDSTMLKALKAYGIDEDDAQYYMDNDMAEALDRVRQSGGNRQVERALNSYNKAARANQKALREMTDVILGDLGETRKHDLKLDGAALSFYEDKVRSMLLRGHFVYPIEIR